MTRRMNFVIPLFWLSVLVLVPALPLWGAARDKSGKAKEDPLIAAMKFVKVPKGTFWMSKKYENAQVQVEIKTDFELNSSTHKRKWLSLRRVDRQPYR